MSVVMDRDISVVTDDPRHDYGLRGKELFDFVLKQIDVHPEQWNQESYGSRSEPTFRQLMEEIRCRRDIVQICDSAFCVAGWACVMAGDPPIFKPGHRQAGVTLRGNHIHWYAGRLLGLTRDQSILLFSPVNNRRDLDRIAAEIWVDQ